MKEMECMQEMVPLAKEMLSQKPGRGMVKVYVAGTVLAFFGVVFGLVETFYQSFLPRESMDVELAWFIAREHLLQEHKKMGVELTETSAAAEAGAASKHPVTAVQRNTATCLHAS